MFKFPFEWIHAEATGLRKCYNLKNLHQNDISIPTQTLDQTRILTTLPNLNTDTSKKTNSKLKEKRKYFFFCFYIQNNCFIMFVMSVKFWF